MAVVALRTRDGIRSLRWVGWRWVIRRRAKVTLLGTSRTPRRASPLSLGSLHRPDRWWRDISGLGNSLDLLHAPVRLLVTSAHPGEGKSTTALGLALHAVETLHLSTVILDLDLWRPRVLQILDCEGGCPLSEVLSGRAQVTTAVHLHPSGLHAIGSHRPTPESAHMVTEHAVGKLVSELADKYQAVIVDSPPMIPVPEAAGIAAGVGGRSLIVANPGIATPADLRQVENVLRGVCTEIGVFLVMGGTDRNRAGQSRRA